MVHGFFYYPQVDRIGAGFLGRVQIDRFRNIDLTVIGDVDLIARLSGCGDR